MTTAAASRPKTPVKLPEPDSDFYSVREILSAEEQALLQKVRAFMEAKVAPIINDYWAKDAFPFELIPAMKSAGIETSAMYP